VWGTHWLFVLLKLWLPVPLVSISAEWEGLPAVIMAFNAQRRAGYPLTEL